VSSRLGFVEFHACSDDSSPSLRVPTTEVGGGLGDLFPTVLEGALGGHGGRVGRGRRRRLSGAGG